MRKVIFFFLASLLALSLISCSSTEEDTEKRKADIYFASGTQHLVKKNYTQALTHLLKAVKLAPERSEIHNNLGMAYYFKGSKKNALSHIKHAIKLDPKNTDARSNLASIYLENNMLKRARKEYETILEDLTYPKQHQTYYNLGVLELKLKRPEKAKKFFDLSVKENQYYCPAYLQSGLLDLKNKNFDVAYQSFDKGTDGPCFNYEPNFYYKALSLQKQGKFNKASKVYTQILQRFPKSRYHAMAKEKLNSIQSSTDFENVIYSEGNTEKDKIDEIDNLNL
ncbi:MAG: tetratricopeptide repeat protein [Halobacteriovoraceae bacterium]|nr:tetratricopeptide repeat protein [Halobacteriovoraceae bacterium]MCB9095959.1 tetratricopeptide repeat protein [Halobacteriovoraceae bacterium]